MQQSIPHTAFEGIDSHGLHRNCGHQGGLIAFDDLDALLDGRRVAALLVALAIEAVT